MATSYHSLKDYNESIPYYLEALELDEKLLGKEHENVLAGYESLAEVYALVSESNLSLEYAKRALAFRERNYGKEDPLTEEIRLEVEAREKKIK